MSRWMCGITRVNGIRNEIIIQTTKVVEISRKVHESLQWEGHIMRKMKLCWEESDGCGGERVRRTGKCRRRWRDCVEEDLRQ